MLPKPINVIRGIIMFLLCIFYSAWVTFGILIAYVFKRDTKFWVVKERNSKPVQLSSEEYGKHKFAHVNVKNFTFTLREKKIQVFNFIATM